MANLIHVSPGINRVGQEEFARQLARTFVGMAHLAGTGPSGTTCRECAHWLHRSSWAKADFEHQGAPKPAPCRRYQQLTHRTRSERVPHCAQACQHFELSDNPQPLRQPAKGGA